MEFKLVSEENDQWFEDMFSEYVPDEGKADTIGGEIIRAYMKVMYRYYNDGDMVGISYPDETAYLESAVSFVRRYVPGMMSFYACDENDYEKILRHNENVIVEFLQINTKLFERPNNVDSLDCC